MYYYIIYLLVSFIFFSHRNMSLNWSLTFHNVFTKCLSTTVCVCVCVCMLACHHCNNKTCVPHYVRFSFVRGLFSFPPNTVFFVWAVRMERGRSPRNWTSILISLVMRVQQERCAMESFCDFLLFFWSAFALECLLSCALVYVIVIQIHQYESDIISMYVMSMRWS